MCDAVGVIFPFARLASEHWRVSVYRVGQYAGWYILALTAAKTGAAVTIPACTHL